ncbi:MAG: hypothetical protein K9N09_04405 [Candidatus Cloacimonetes bacterium]|nr:hypothetical protein [Candidatus Cloacimonadota bacterium]MCF7813606.1 hypothetical protein [Candidatus Cloacimonadota bacterium]MCF7867922.1 hypothetical protein [Candidatus Cloacimonadota bacterium]MCF7882885.1 hypothetical protein [Candidatus Cloacimonadota bacterium]
MKKLVIVLFVISLTFHAFCAEKAIEMKFDDVELKLDNIILSDVNFIAGNKIVVYSKSIEDIDMTSTKFVVTISAEDETKIELGLPVTKCYQYQKDDLICKFDSEVVNVESDDVFVVISDEGIKVNDYNDGSEITITDDGITVDSVSEKVKIDDSGIMVEDRSESIHLKGHLGFIASFFARNATNAALNMVGKSPEKVFKLVVNEDYDETTVHYNFGSM